MAIPKRKLQFVLAAFGCIALLLFVVLVWLFADFGANGSDEKRYQHLGRTARSYAWISSLEKKLPKPVARILRLRHLEMEYQDKCERDIDALIDSGYLRGTRFTVSNLAANWPQLRNTVADVLKGTGYWGASLHTASDEVTVYCRPQYVPQLRKALPQ
jgi:hypothetical protein